MAELTMWKKTVNKDYLGSWDLCIGADANEKPIYKEVIFTIKDVKQELVTDMEKVKTNRNIKATKEELSKEEILIYFEEFSKPMIIHAKTNFKSLEKATGTPFIEKWIGKKICVYVEKGVKAFGIETDALRIKTVPKRMCSVCGNIMDNKLFEQTFNAYGRSICSKECKERAGL